MSERDQLIEAFILHARKYRDTSMIVELLTREHGRVPVVMRGVRSARSRIAGHVQPFGRMMIAWFGRGELKTARATDFPWTAPVFTGNELVTGLYVNELLVRLAGKYEPMPRIFDAYGPLIHKIAAGIDMPAELRRFELGLLRELGYGITFDVEAGSGEPVAVGTLYRYVPDEGLHRIVDDMTGHQALRGADLLAIARGDLTDPGADACAKRVIRRSFAALLGERKLKSRELFPGLEVPQ